MPWSTLLRSVWFWPEQQKTYGHQLKVFGAMYRIFWNTLNLTFTGSLKSKTLIKANSWDVGWGSVVTLGLGWSIISYNTMVM